MADKDNDGKDLLDLFIHVIDHSNIKAFSLHQLIILYIQGSKTVEEEESEE